MKKNILLILKVIALISAIIFALIAVLYLSNLLSAEYVKLLAEKIIILIGVLSAVSLIIIFLSDKQKK